MNASIPEPPDFSQDLKDTCTSKNDFRPMLFEWYKYVGQLTLSIASISPESKAYRDIPKTHHAVLVGLLNRCTRLVLTNLELSQKRYFGESFQIIDRCIFESAMKVIWLCAENSDDAFNRFLADGLKSDLELKHIIEENIQLRNDQPQVIELRMLKSIENCRAESGLSVQQVQVTKKLPTLDSMLNKFEKRESRLKYVVFQKIGSHAVHGTWTNLVKSYLKKEGDRFVLRDHNVEVQDIQFVTSSLHILRALSAYVGYVFLDEEIAQGVIGIFDGIWEEIIGIHRKPGSDDFELAVT